MDSEETAAAAQLAKLEWLFELAGLWEKTDPEFAELLRARARRIQRDEPLAVPRTRASG